MSKSVPTALVSHFDSSLNQFSPVLPENAMKKVVDSDGVERVEFLPVDTKEIIASFGTVDNWSLKSLMAAGVDLSTGIRTGSVSRSEGANDLNEIVAEVENYSETENESEK